MHILFGPHLRPERPAPTRMSEASTSTTKRSGWLNTGAEVNLGFRAVTDKWNFSGGESCVLLSDYAAVCHELVVAIDETQKLLQTFAWDMSGQEGLLFIITICVKVKWFVQVSMNMGRSLFLFHYLLPAVHSEVLPFTSSQVLHLYPPGWLILADKANKQDVKQILKPFAFEIPVLTKVERIFLILF